MFIPIRNRVGLRNLFVAGAVGVLVSYYVWEPILKEQIEKEKEKQRKSKELTETNQKP